MESSPFETKFSSSVCPYIFQVENSSSIMVTERYLAISEDLNKSNIFLQVKMMLNRIVNEGK
jgi:hypothetical protein